MLFLLVVGPTVYMLQAFTQNLGFYSRTSRAEPLDRDISRRSDWQDTWTMFYWGWWISWSPFVGMFIARISKGRTVRELSSASCYSDPDVFHVDVVFGGSALSSTNRTTSRHHQRGQRGCLDRNVRDAG